MKAYRTRILRELKMPSSNEKKVEQLRSLFEGREAIYVEKGALRARVRNIRMGHDGIMADVEEIPTAGLPVGALYAIQRREPSPLRWTIGVGFISTSSFSDHNWHMGYGGWSIFFAPKIIESIVTLALQFPESLNPGERYDQVIASLKDHKAYERTQRLFAKSFLG
jgi:hypothetical protein